MHLLVYREAWQGLGNCRDEDTGVFFPDGRKPDYKLARAYCGACVVKEECLDYALRIHEKRGMWGGKTPEERDKTLARIRKIGAQAIDETQNISLVV